MRRFIKLSAEAQAAAAHLARRGVLPEPGAPLPLNMTPQAVEEINNNLNAFRLAWHMAGGTFQE